MIVKDKTFQRDLGAHIRRKRLQCELTLSELAQRVGLCKSMISQVENGHNAISLAALLSVCRVLNLNLQEIVTQTFPRRCSRCKGTGIL